MSSRRGRAVTFKQFDLAVPAIDTAYAVVEDPDGNPVGMMSPIPER